MMYTRLSPMKSRSCPLPCGEHTEATHRQVYPGKGTPNHTPGNTPRAWVRACLGVGGRGPAWGLGDVPGGAEPTARWCASEAAGECGEVTWGGGPVGPRAPPGTHLMGIEINDGGSGDTLHSLKQKLPRAGEGRGKDHTGQRTQPCRGSQLARGWAEAYTCLREIRPPGRALGSCVALEKPVCVFREGSLEGHVLCPEGPEVRRL